MCLTDFQNRCTFIKHDISWCPIVSSDVAVPYMTIGRMVMECRYGPERHAGQKQQKKATKVLSLPLIVFLPVYICHVILM